ncbi:hypothetical protein MOQ_000952 [Trypanosoma cruzi marinkellei]|uniref:Uncharacterized protein n=1 Tax=Trypanosoma cruzi marinkellei TaxID=85056 RepID=K2NV24_TRYCR|nr:hypothetical protein MOQ_000952 [Trypanosoma cruzi marinkellei]
MGGSSHRRLLSNAEGDGVSKGDERELQLTRTQTHSQLLLVKHSEEELISGGNREPARCGIEKHLDADPDVIVLLPEIEEVTSRVRPTVRDASEEKAEVAAQHRLSHAYFGTSSTSSSHMHTGECFSLYEECLPIDTAFNDRICAFEEQSILTTSIKTEDPGMTPLQGAIARVGRNCGEGPAKRCSPISYSLARQEASGMVSGGTSSINESAIHQGTLVFAPTPDTEGSLIVAPSASCGIAGPREDMALRQAQYSRRESTLSPANLIAVATPRAIDLFCLDSSNVENNLSLVVADESSDPNLNFTRFSSRTDNNPAAGRQVNTPNLGCELYRQSGDLRSFGSANEALEAMWQGRGSQIYGPSATSHGAMGNVSGSAGEYRFGPLFGDNLNGNLFEEFFLFSSHQVQIPPFRKPVDVTPLLEMADRDLASKTTPLVPVLSSHVPGVEEEGVRSSRDSLTLESISWLNSLVDPHASRQQS